MAHPAARRSELFAARPLGGGRTLAPETVAFRVHIASRPASPRMKAPHIKDIHVRRRRAPRALRAIHLSTLRRWGRSREALGLDEADRPRRRGRLRVSG